MEETKTTLKSLRRPKQIKRRKRSALVNKGTKKRGKTKPEKWAPRDVANRWVRREDLSGGLGEGECILQKEMRKGKR